MIFHSYDKLPEGIPHDCLKATVFRPCLKTQRAAQRNNCKDASANHLFVRDDKVFSGGILTGITWDNGGYYGRHMVNDGYYMVNDG